VRSDPAQRLFGDVEESIGRQQVVDLVVREVTVTVVAREHDVVVGSLGDGREAATGAVVVPNGRSRLEVSAVVVNE
jgi:hypothetical protein